MCGSRVTFEDGRRAGVHHRGRPPRHPGGHGPRSRSCTRGEEVLLARIGGTLPATTLFEEVLGAKTLFFSFALADEWHHAPNEFMRVRRLREGMRAWEVLLRLLAEGEHRLESTS